MGPTKNPPPLRINSLKTKCAGGSGSPSVPHQRFAPDIYTGKRKQDLVCGVHRGSGCGVGAMRLVVVRWAAGSIQHAAPCAAPAVTRAHKPPAPLATTNTTKTTGIALSPNLSSDCKLQLVYVKLESLVIAGQPYGSEFVPRPCTHRPSHHGNWSALKMLL